VKVTKEDVAACGLLCHECSINLAHSDEEHAKKLMDWFLERGYLKEAKPLKQFMEDGPYCDGCHGKKETHWSPTCWILRCCVDKKSLQNCTECSDFPCTDLKKWSEQNGDYSEAFERLTTMSEQLRDTSYPIF